MNLCRENHGNLFTLLSKEMARFTSSHGFVRIVGIRSKAGRVANFMRLEKLVAISQRVPSFHNINAMIGAGHGIRVESTLTVHYSKSLQVGRGFSNG